MVSGFELTQATHSNSQVKGGVLVHASVFASFFFVHLREVWINCKLYQLHLKISARYEIETCSCKNAETIITLARMADGNRCEQNMQCCTILYVAVLASKF